MTQRIPTRVNTLVPDRIAKFEEPSNRWIIAHQPARGPYIVGLTINPRMSDIDTVSTQLANLMVGIEHIDHSSCALLFALPVAGEVAYQDSVDASRAVYCYAVDYTEHQSSYRAEFYLPDSLIGRDVVVTHWLRDDKYIPFNYRDLNRSHQSLEKMSLEFNTVVPSTRFILRDRKEVR